MTVKEINLVTEMLNNQENGRPVSRAIGKILANTKNYEFTTKDLKDLVTVSDLSEEVKEILEKEFYPQNSKKVYIPINSNYNLPGEEKSTRVYL